MNNFKDLLLLNLNELLDFFLDGGSRKVACESVRIVGLSCGIFGIEFSRFNRSSIFNFKIKIKTRLILFLFFSFQGSIQIKVRKLRLLLYAYINNR